MLPKNSDSQLVSPLIPTATLVLTTAFIISITLYLVGHHWKQSFHPQHPPDCSSSLTTLPHHDHSPFPSSVSATFLSRARSPRFHDPRSARSSGFMEGSVRSAAVYERDKLFSGYSSGLPSGALHLRERFRDLLGTIQKADLSSLDE